MKKPYILVVEPCSSGLNFIADIIAHNYRPLVLEIKSNNERYVKIIRPKNRKFYESCSTVISEQSTYSKTLNLIKKYHPVCGVTCSEMTLTLATRLFDDLHFPTISYKHLNRYIDKYVMHEELKKAGVRYIRGKMIYSMAEGIKCYKQLGKKKVIIKPTFGTGSFGLHVCNNVSEVKTALKDLLGKNNLYGKKQDGVLLEERISGVEYYINTMSRHGIHRILSASRYVLNELSQLSYIDSALMCDFEEIKRFHIDEYILSVLDALGIKDGPVHSEVFIDKKGPVLLEVNCRICGANIPSSLLDYTIGMHDSNEIIDGLLDFNNFRKKASYKMPYKMKAIGGFHLCHVNETCTLVDLPVIEILNNLPSIFSFDIKQLHEPKTYSLTHDIFTIIGIVYLANKDRQQFDKDFNLLTELDKKFPRLCYTKQGDSPIKKYKPYYGNSLDKIAKNNKVIILTDIILNKMVNNAVLNLNLEKIYQQNKMTLSKLYLGLFRLLKKVKGTIYVPRPTYECLPYGKKGTSILLSVLGFQEIKTSMKDMLVMKRVNN